jgi:hypothetical protein
MCRLAKTVLAASCLVAGCSHTRVPVSLTHSSVLAKAGLESYWQLHLKLPEGERIERLCLLEENLYCLTNTNYLIAVDAAKGVRKWSRKVAEPGETVFPPCHANEARLQKELPGIREIVTPRAPETLPPANVVLVNTPDYVLVLERQTGDRLRKIDFDISPHEFTANTGGGCDGRFFYVGSVSGRCHAIRLNEGVVAWVLPTKDILTASPRCHSPGGSDRVFVAGEDGELYVALAGTPLRRLWPPEGTRQWPAMAGPVTAQFHVDDRACFVPCVNRRLYAFAMSGGDPLWRFTCGGTLVHPVQVSENSVFQYAEADRLYAINPANGELRWSMPRGRRVLAAMPVQEVPTAYLVDYAGNLLVVDEILGKVRASIPLTGCDLFADNTSAPAVYIGSRDGRLYCLRQVGAGQLTAEMLIKVKPKPKPTAK